jgi:hypothetical protein
MSMNVCIVEINQFTSVTSFTILVYDEVYCLGLFNSWRCFIASVCTQSYGMYYYHCRPNSLRRISLAVYALLCKARRCVYTGPADNDYIIQLSSTFGCGSSVVVAVCRHRDSDKYQALFMPINFVSVSRRMWGCQSSATKYAIAFLSTNNVRTLWRQDRCISLCLCLCIYGLWRYINIYYEYSIIITV